MYCFNQRIISLDLLRGLAAYLVAIPHYFIFMGVDSKFLEFITLFSVEIFFILSGFVLGPQLEKIFKYSTYNNLKILAPKVDAYTSNLSNNYAKYRCDNT